MKKLMAIFLSLVFVVAMAACSNNNTITPDDTNTKKPGGVLYGKIESINGAEFNLMVLEDLGVDAMCPLDSEDPNATVDDNGTGGTIPMPISVPSDTQQITGSSIPNNAGDSTSEGSTAGGNVAMPLPYDKDSITQLYLVENGEYQKLTFQRDVEIVDPAERKLEFKDLKVGATIMVTFDEATGEIKQITILQ